MTAVARAIDRVFADPNMALDALWFTGGAGAGQAVRVIRRAPDAEVAFGQARILTDAARFDLRVADLARPAEGDRIVIGSEAYLVLGEPRRDRLGLVWTVETEPQ
ncbi:head-tail joining protein [Rubellimicrobium aerolatum]|uniref:Head-tail adaptor protein n=1 Tax=Rubellimicrobium aerolatum TaxID=490979 RepID=A0ABW0SEV9_9RHOB|nr:hypothetical protein [Rubellimicrobium aerolatum]MBP1806465.1 hypothetical protein [Rubellimicrobium aerolatum]